MDYKHRHEFNLLIEMLEYALDIGLLFKMIRTDRNRKSGNSITCSDAYGKCAGETSIRCALGGNRKDGSNTDFLLMFATDIDKQHIESDPILCNEVKIHKNNPSDAKKRPWRISFGLDTGLFKRAIHILAQNEANVPENDNNTLSRVPSEKDPCIVKYRIKQENQVYIQYLDWQYSLYYDMSNCKAGDSVRGSDGYYYEILQVYKVEKP